MHFPVLTARVNPGAIIIDWILLVRSIDMI